MGHVAAHGEKCALECEDVRNNGRHVCMRQGATVEKVTGVGWGAYSADPDGSSWQAHTENMEIDNIGVMF